MGKNLFLGIIAFVLLCRSCEEEAVTTVATEVWQVTIGENAGYGTSTFYKKSDKTIITEGEWRFYDADTTVMCPYAAGEASVEGDSLKFEASGTAFHPGAPVGYQHSAFVLKVNGKAAGGNFQGHFEISFSTFGWPPTKTGDVTAVRISGSGITL